MTLIDAVRQIVARKIAEHRHPAIAIEREVHALRGVATTAEDIAAAAGALAVGRTFYENFYKLNQTQTL